MSTPYCKYHSRDPVFRCVICVYERGLQKGAVLRSFYRGLDIEVCCVKKKRSLSHLLQPPKYFAVGIASLRGTKNVYQWVDFRPQTVTTGDRIFLSSTECSEQLIFEIKMLIDAVQK